MQNNRSIMDTLQEIYDGDPSLRLASDLLILRLPVERSWSQASFTAGALPVEIAGSKDGLEVFARAADRPVLILASESGSHWLSANLNLFNGVAALDHDSTFDAANAIARICDAEIDDLLERSRAILTSAPDTVFRAPSGRVVRNFVRVGNLQCDRDAIDAIFFWLIPHLKRCAAILTDTWSISSIAFNVARLAQTYFDGPIRRVEMLTDYLDGSAASEGRARSIIERLTFETEGSETFDEILCLVSATQSGSMQERMAAFAPTGTGGLVHRFVALIALGETSMPSLRDLSGDTRFRLLPEPTAPSGMDTSHPVPIDPKVYFPLVFQDQEVAVTKPYAEASRGIIDAFAASGVMSVHTTVERDGRRMHEAIGIATERFLKLPTFVRGFEDALSQSTRAPLLIIAPPRAGCFRLAEHASRYLKRRNRRSRVFLHSTLNLAALQNRSRIEEAVRSTLRNATQNEEIVIIVDVWKDDGSLAQYERALRNEHYQGRVRFIVGLARPGDVADWEHAARRLRQGDRHDVTAVFTMPLPHSPSCAWCEELRLLEKWAARVPPPPAIKDRISCLAAASATGLSGDFALMLQGTEPMRLGPKSFFVNQDSSQVDAFIAVSAALQRLRTRSPETGPRLGPRRFPTSTVLKETDYLRETWTDSVLRACFLRASTFDELVFTDARREQLRTTRVRELLLDPETLQNELAPELLLAAALGKASVEIDDDLRARLSAIDADGMLSYMLDMIAYDTTTGARTAAVASARPISTSAAA